MLKPSRGNDRPFSLDEWFERAPGVPLLRPLAWLADQVLGLAALQRLYHELPADERPFPERALASLGVRYHVTAGDALKIPRTGPLIVIANHPYGGLDGLVLASILTGVRPDVRLFANYLLGRIPELRDSLFLVDPFGSRSMIRGNAAVMRRAIRWVRDGGALALFPSGEVSNVLTAAGPPVDPAWMRSLAPLVRRTRAPVLPVFFEGGNSAMFQLAGRAHPWLRTALLPRELLRQRHRTIAVRIGAPISWIRLEDFKNNEQVTSYLRLRTYALGSVQSATAEQGRHSSSALEVQAPPAAPEAPDTLASEISRLPPPRLLCRSGDLAVYIGTSGELPRTLLEIGRLREITFRCVGEGSGRCRDLDRFDHHYLHLFVWNARNREIVGAYRAGQTDQILPRFGIDGLYTSTLFAYRPRLLEEMGTALELGRAFVRPEYQRDYSPLLLLWKGIGSYVAAHPQYRMLLGPVSISNDYQSLSREILVKFLHATSFDPRLARFVTPRNPAAFLRGGRSTPPVISTVVKSIAEVGALLADIEADGKGVPVLLRQYLKLNARLLGFNVDPAFGNALDGLMLVDLLEVNREILFRYMGRTGALAFAAHHAHAVERRAS